jgi:hypothetical protein
LLVALSVDAIGDVQERNAEKTSDGVPDQDPTGLFHHEEPTGSVPRGTDCDGTVEPIHHQPQSKILWRVRRRWSVRNAQEQEEGRQIRSCATRVSAPKPTGRPI